MASAAERLKRDIEIRIRRAENASIPELAAEFYLSETRIKQVLSENSDSPIGWDMTESIELALQRRAQYQAVYEEISAFAAEIPVTQASAKTGALKAKADALERLIRLDQSLGLLPYDLGVLAAERDARRTARAILQVVRRHDASVELTQDLIDALK